MRYVRRSRYRNRRYRKRGPKVVGSTRSIAVKALRTAKYVKKVAKPEVLYITTSPSGVGGTTAQILLLNSIPQGDTNGTRTGDLVRVTTLPYILSLIINAGALTDTVRVLFILQKLPVTVGTPPVANTIFNNASSPLAPINLVTGNRYKILSNKIYSLSQSGMPIRVIKSTIKVDTISKWSDGTDVNIEKNALWFVIISTENTNKLSFALNSVTKYSDV